jgi:hypothetical protein
MNERQVIDRIMVALNDIVEADPHIRGRGIIDAGRAGQVLVNMSDGFPDLPDRIAGLEAENKRIRESSEMLIIAVNNLNHTKMQDIPGMLSAWANVFRMVDEVRAAIEKKE